MNPVRTMRTIDRLFLNGVSMNKQLEINKESEF